MLLLVISQLNMKLYRLANDFGNMLGSLLYIYIYIYIYIYNIYIYINIFLINIHSCLKHILHLGCPYPVAIKYIFHYHRSTYKLLHMLKIHKKECQFYKQVAIHNKCDKSIIMITYLIQINIHFFLPLIQI